MSETPVSNAGKRDYRKHRNRPFLVVDFYFRPAPGVRTERKNWMHMTGNVDVAESPYMVDRLSEKILRRACVIVDLSTDTVVKSRLPDVSDEDIVKHYKGKCSGQIQRGLEVWAARQPIAA